MQQTCRAGVCCCCCCCSAHHHSPGQHVLLQAPVIGSRCHRPGALAMACCCRSCWLSAAVHPSACAMPGMPLLLPQLPLLLSTLRYGVLPLLRITPAGYSSSSSSTEQQLVSAPVEAAHCQIKVGAGTAPGLCTSVRRKCEAEV